MSSEERAPDASPAADAAATGGDVPASGSTAAPAQPAGRSGDAVQTDEPMATAAVAGGVQPAKPPAGKGAMLPPPSRRMPPPAPRARAESRGAAPDAAAPDGQDSAAPGEAARRARAAALASASRAASHVTPAQRDKAIAEAAAAAAAGAYESSKSQPQAAAAADPGAQQPQQQQQQQEPARAMATYQEPEWAGAPEGAAFSLEVMKGGQILGAQQLAGRASYSFGRAPGSDFLLEHPSISRLHAVLQFSAEGPPRLFDCGSAHGSFANKRRLPPREFVQLSVGDILRFGQSSRLFILGGPPELMPAEGPSRAQRQQARVQQAAVEAKERRLLEEEQVSKAQMAAALSKGVSWGMGEDAAADSDDDSPAVDWRAYSQANPLSERQQKLAERVRRLETRIRNLTTESERIRAKQTSMADLTPGQAAQLARNEQAIDKASEELEEAEEALNDSVGDAIRGRRREGEAKGKGAAAKRSRKRAAEEQEDEAAAAADSSDDDFYDRTAPGKAKKRRAETATVVHDAASLFGRKAALQEERVRLAQQLQAAEAEAAGQPPDAAGQPAEAGEKLPEASTSADPLDAFMSGNAAELEQSKVGRLQQEVATAEAEVLKLERLLKAADPDGYYREGTHAAKLAREKGLRLFHRDRERQAATERRRRQQQAQERERAAAAAAFVPETEEPEAEPPAAAVTPAAADQVHRLEGQAGGGPGGLRLPQAASAALPAEPPAGESAAAAAATPPVGLYVPERQNVEAKRRRDAVVRAAAARDAAAKQQPQAQGGGGAEGGSREDAVLADLAVLQRVSRAGEDAAAASAARVDIAGTGWAPPQGQSGDGRTALNEKLGY